MDQKWAWGCKTTFGFPSSAGVEQPLVAVANDFLSIFAASGGEKNIYGGVRNVFTHCDSVRKYDRLYIGGKSTL
jgi:hypothetical protein